MIKLNNLNKYNILYKNYIKQFSPAYLQGCPIYIGDCLLNNNKSIYINKNITNIINKYKNNFINLLMTNNKVQEELINEDLCFICLEKLNLYPIKTDFCNKCHIKCHIHCLNLWHNETQKQNICPICLSNNENNKENEGSIVEYNEEEEEENKKRCKDYIYKSLYFSIIMGFLIRVYNI